MVLIITLNLWKHLEVIEPTAGLAHCNQKPSYYYNQAMLTWASKNLLITV